MNKIDQISVTFFQRYALSTVGRLNELGRRRFMDNLFYSFANCSSRIYLEDQARDTRHTGSAAELSDLLADLVEKDKEDLSSSGVDVSFNASGPSGSSLLSKVGKDFPFLKMLATPEFGTMIQDVSIKFFSAICQLYTSERPTSSQESLASGFTEFLADLRPETILHPPSMDKFKISSQNLNSEIEKFKVKMSTFFPVNLAQSLDEVSAAVERKLTNIRGSLDALSHEISSVSSHSNYSKLKIEFEVVQKALRDIKESIYQPLSRTRSKGENDIHFENKDQNVEENNGLTDEAVPFFAFYRVKSVSKHKKILKNTRKTGPKNPSVKSIKTFEYGFSEMGSSDSISYHICDTEGRTLSQLEEYSDDTSPRLNYRLSGDRLIKKNQSMDKFGSKGPVEDPRFLCTIDLPGHDDTLLKNLELEINVIKKVAGVIGVDMSSLVDRSAAEWKLDANEEEKIIEKLLQVEELNERLRQLEADKFDLVEGIGKLTLQIGLENTRREELEASLKLADLRVIHISGKLRLIHSRSESILKALIIPMFDSEKRVKGLLHELRNLGQNIFKQIKIRDSEKMEAENLNGNSLQLRTRLSSFSDRIDLISESASEGADSSSLAISKLVKRLKEVPLKIKGLRADISDLRYINGNLLKELQILSTSQQLLSKEKEQLEDQLRQKEDLEEKTRELSLTVKVLEEKLEMSNSLREMAESKCENFEENEVGNGNSHKSQEDIFNREYNFNKHLGTIDENEELVEISDTHEQVLYTKESQHADPNEERFRSQDLLLPKVQVRDIVKSYSLKFHTPQTMDEPQLLSQRSSIHNEALQRSDTKFERQSYEDFTSNKDKMRNSGYEKRSSGKKSLFSMENVLKSIGEVSKPEPKSSAFSKAIGEFTAIEEIGSTRQNSHSFENRLRQLLKVMARRFKTFERSFSEQRYLLDERMTVIQEKLLNVQLLQNIHIDTSVTSYKNHSSSEEIVQMSLTDRMKMMGEQKETPKPTQRLFPKIGASDQKFTQLRSSYGNTSANNKLLLPNLRDQMETLHVPAKQLEKPSNEKAQHKDLVDSKAAERKLADCVQHINQLKASNDSLKIESIKLLGENENLGDLNRELNGIIERSFEIARTLINNPTDDDVTLKPRYLDRLLDMIGSRFENFQTMFEAMDEEIKMLKNEMFSSEEAPVTETGENGRDSVDKLHLTSLRDVRKNGSTTGPEKKLFQLDDYDYDANSNSEFRNNKVKIGSNGTVSQNSLALSKKLSHSKLQNGIPDLFTHQNQASKNKATHNESLDSYEPSENNDADQENLHDEENFENIENITSFTEKQKILKEGFWELLNNIMIVVEENKEYIVSVKNGLSILKAKDRQPESSLNEDLDLLKNNNIHLREMVEFLTKNLMMFLEELEELKLESKQGAPSYHMDDLIEENQFLYQKLNEVNEELAASRNQLPDVHKNHKNPKRGGQDHNSTQSVKTEMKPDPENIEGKLLSENKEEDTDTYNAFLLNILRQIKAAIDDSNLNQQAKMMRLREISRDLDTMFCKKGHLQQRELRETPGRISRVAFQGGGHPA